MKLRHLPVFVAACLAPATAPSGALSASSHLTEIADGGVVAVRNPGEIRTGFALGNAGFVIAGTSVGSGVRLINARGLSAAGDSVTHDGELAVVHTPKLHLFALRRSGVREIGPGTLAYVLGAPLGYDGKRIQAVRLPTVKLHSTAMVAIAGALPKSFQGAPVVTQAGKVIGAVATVSASSWMLAPQIRLSTLLKAATKPSGGEGVPAMSILAGVLVAIAALGGLVAVRTRRNRDGGERAPAIARQRPVRDPAQWPIEDPTQHSTQPLVRRRGSAVDNDEDFDVVLRSQRTDEPS